MYMGICRRAEHGASVILPRIVLFLHSFQVEERSAKAFQIARELQGLKTWRTQHTGFGSIVERVIQDLVPHMTAPHIHMLNFALKAQKATVLPLICPELYATEFDEVRFNTLFCTPRPSGYWFF